MTIRTAQLTDIEALILLLAELFQIETDFQINPVKQRTGLELLLASDTAQIVVAEHQAKVVGMCSVQVLISTAEGAKVGLIEDLIVSEAYRGLGIGHRLLAHLETWATAHGLKRLQLLAAKHNQLALDFYTAQQWNLTQFIGLRKQL